MTRRTTRLGWLALGVALPTVLLGAGWLAASIRARASSLREEEMRLRGIAGAVRGAIDESLEDLRRREDERPFYLYHHYYSPPEVLAISDPVAVSPLAAGPSDSRVVGWFQVDPDGTVRTPWTVDPAERGPAAAAHVREVASGDALADMRALVHGHESGQLVARAREPASPVLFADASDSVRPRTRRDGSEIAPSITRTVDPEPPVTVALNAYAVELANEIQQAQAGDVSAYGRVAQRGRSAPVTVRRSVDISEIESQQQAQTQQAQRQARQQAGDLGALTDPSREVRRAPPEQAPRPRVPVDAAATAPSAPSPPLVPTSIEVDYTPMRWRAEGDVVAMTRVVSHEGAAVLQGVVLDRSAIAERWIPEVIGRIAAGGPEPRVIAGGEEASCALRAPASETLPDLDLCFDALALAARIDALDAEMRWQVALLAGLVLAVAAAAFAVQRASRRAEELAEQRSAFVSAVSHELRTPLTTIRMHAEMLDEDMVEEARKPKVFREIVTESVRLSRLVENVLEISRLEEGRRPLRKSRSDLAGHVAEIGRQQIPFVQGKGLELEVCEAEPIETAFDAQAIEQIVVNLIDNAVKYGASPIEVDVAREPSSAVIIVRDRGLGIPESERSKVFERFHRVERPETAHKPGTGIGLALVRDLARAHGGDAEARGREGGGCELRVTLPAG